MCGIVGYCGNRKAIPLIIEGLEKLEYRGYDSAGIAVIRSGEIEVTRAVGKLIELKKVLGDRLVNDPASVGIGHTRWATHGKPSETNAHPHSAGRVSLIHNGIIENYSELKAELQKEGRVFKSETDTEIGAHLLDKHLQSGLAPFEALKKTCSEIRGSFAFVAIDAKNPDRLLIAKNATPIVLGIAEGEIFVASDIPAILSSTRKVIILEDGDMAELKADSIYLENNGKKIEREIQTVTWDPVTAQKGGFKHFMLKEIHEQTTVLAECFRGRVNPETAEVTLSDIGISNEQIERVSKINIVACGTAMHAGLVAKFYFESLAAIPTEVDYASEFRYRLTAFKEQIGTSGLQNAVGKILNDSTLVMPISQSGETADTLAATELGLSKEYGSKALGLGICNVVGSSIARRVKNVVFTQAGPEISVASTKAFTTQIISSFLLALHFGEIRKQISPDRAKSLVSDLLKLPSAIERALHIDESIQTVAKKFAGASNFLFLGRGICYPIALEGALKLKEISYIHAEGYPAGEMKHGPIALIDENMPVVVVLQKSDVMFEKTISNLKEVEARSGRIIAITDVAGHKELHSVCEHVIEVPFVNEYLSPVILTVPLQLLAYHVSNINGTDVDLPRNLAKSVTVE